MKLDSIQTIIMAQYHRNSSHNNRHHHDNYGVWYQVSKYTIETELTQRHFI